MASLLVIGLLVVSILTMLWSTLYAMLEYLI